MLTIEAMEPASFDLVEQRWRQLEARVGCSFFQSWAWVGCLAAERFDDPVLIEARRQGELVALALFNRRRGTWPRRDRLWLAESGRPAWDRLFIEHNGVLIAAGADDALHGCLLAALRGGRRRRSLVLSGIGDAQLRLADTLDAACTGRQTRLAPYVDLAAIRRTGGRPIDQLSANTRHQLRRSARRYGEIGPLRVTRAGSAAQAHAFLGEMASLHQATWTTRGRAGAFADPAFGRFHHALIDRTDAVQLLRIDAGDRVVGYLHGFCFRGRVSAYQSGFDYASAPVHAKPGMTCHQLAIERYLAEGMQAYDFLAGADRYKTSLATGSVPLHWVTLVPARSPEALLHRLGTGLRRLLRALPLLGLGWTASAACAAPPPEARSLVGLVLQNQRDAAVAARMLTFGQAFLPGQLPAGSGLAAVSAGRQIPVQLDVKASFADGSARLGALSLTAPPLAAHRSVALMLMRAPPPADPALDLSTALRRYDLTVELTIRSGSQATPYRLDAHALLDRALAAGSTASWLRGPQASEVRIDAPVAGSMHLSLDIRGYRDGTSRTDVQFRNDLAMQRSGGAITYDATIRLGGRTVYARAGIRQFQYQSWHRVVWSTDAPPINVRHDVAALERTGLIADYDLNGGVARAVLAGEAATMAQLDWGAPLAANGLTRYMPTTGGRGEIGPTTLGNAVWLVTQSAQAADFALGQADAAGAVPWQFWDPARGTWLNTDAYPEIWIDGRGGTGATTGLTQQVDAATGWTADTSHQPDLAYVAYLMTASRRYLDLLNAQAAFSILATWPDPQMRHGGEGNVIRGNQLRAAAWSLRQIDEAAWINPAGSAEQAYFARIADANWRWLVAQLPGWSEREGETFGYVLDGEYGTRGQMPPWQQDYFVGTAVQAASLGNRDALAYLRWAENFVAGRFLNAAAGFDPHDGVSYLLGNVVDGATCRSWAQLQQATAAAGQDNGAGWAHSDGDYAELALASLAGIISVTGSPRAVAAYRYLLGAGAPHSDAATRRSDLQYDIVPRSSASGLDPRGSTGQAAARRLAD